jgi:hypothetical protein
MKARVIGFALDSGSVPILDFLSRLEEVTGDEFDGKTIAITQNGEWWRGVLISFKDAQSELKCRRSDGGFVITSEDLEEGTQPADLNFFIFNPSYGRGLYQHYQGSASLGRFEMFLAQRWRKCKAAAIDKILEENPDLKLKQVKADFQPLKCQVLLRPADFETYVRAMTHIRNFEFTEATQFDIRENDFRRLEGQSKSIKHQITFQKHGLMNDIIGGITGLLWGGKLKSAKVSGWDENGIEAEYKLVNDKQTFKEYDYDRLLRGIRIDTADLVNSVQTSSVITELHAIAEQPEVKSLLTMPLKA